MMMLTVMTIVGVSATKMTSIDILVAGNEQQQMALFQETENALTILTDIDKLNHAYESAFMLATFTGDEYTLTDAQKNSGHGFVEKIKDMKTKYPCRRHGLGMSLGGGAPECDMYDFGVKAKKANSGARDEHHRGAGKMVPKAGSKASIL
jgi:hypothetical protein